MYGYIYIHIHMGSSSFLGFEKHVALLGDLHTKDFTFWRSVRGTRINETRKSSFDFNYFMLPL